MDTKAIEYLAKHDLQLGIQYVKEKRAFVPPEEWSSSEILFHIAEAAKVLGEIHERY